MVSKLSPAQADPHHDGDVALVAPKDGTDADEALSKPAHVAANRCPPAAGADFSAGPRMTGPSLDPAFRRADVNNEPSPIDQASPSRRSSRSLARFIVAACVGVAATLAWQSYGGTTMQMIANSAPQLSWLLSSLPAMNPPSGREIVEQPSPPAVQASAPQATSARVGAVASTAAEMATSTAPASPSRDLQQQLETMEQDLAAVRQSVEQLAAGQEQMARDIAKLHAAGQGRRTSALPPAAATPPHKPVPPLQPALQSSTAPLTPPPPEPAPQSSAAPLLPGPPEPPRPPMPVR
jgi:hypothetical protein